ncbi:hypothetical protein GCM10025879_12070 [Leuconostoc litchii]|nr:hypothetical protein GCM10025879_12070 [Leuconostoc litchii]
MLDIKQRKMDSFKTLDHSELSEVVGGAVVLKVAAGMGGAFAAGYTIGYALTKKK